MTTRKDATRRRLGRGLSSLISPAVPVTVPGSGPRQPGEDAAIDRDAAAGSSGPARRVTEVGTPDQAIELLPLTDVVRNPDQPRQQFDDRAIEELAASIRSAGLMQPIVVRPTGAGGGAPFQIVVGERRWRAAERAGLDRIPAVVRRLDDQAAAEWALIENIQREDLNPMERADAFRRLIEVHGLTHQDVADRVGLSRVTVTNLLRLHDLDDVTRELVRLGQLGQAQARALLAITNIEARQHLARLAIREGWSVRTLERRASALSATRRPAARPGAAAPPARADLERRLADHLGTRVKVVAGKRKGSGRLVIDFYSFDQFEGLMQKLGFDTTAL